MLSIDYKIISLVGTRLCWVNMVISSSNFRGWYLTNTALYGEFCIWICNNHNIFASQIKASFASGCYLGGWECVHQSQEVMMVFSIPNLWAPKWPNYYPFHNLTLTLANLAFPSGSEALECLLPIRFDIYIYIRIACCSKTSWVNQNCLCRCETTEAIHANAVDTCCLISIWLKLPFLSSLFS